MTKAILFATAAAIVSSTTRAQDDAVYNSAGTFLGNRSELIADCVKDVEKDKEMAMFDARMVCDCMIGTVLTIDAVDQATDESALDDLDFEAMMASDTALMADFQRCVVSSMQGDVPLRTLGKKTITEMTEQCVVESRARAELKEAGVNANVLCECIFDQIYRKNMTMGDLQSLGDRNSVAFNEVMLPCITRATGAEAEPRLAGAPDVSGKKNTDRVPVLPLGNLHKVKIVIGGMEQYFIIDSGASDCMISNELEQRLRKMNAVTQANYLDPKEYQLADGRTVMCRRFVAQDMRIGEFRVNNVTVAVIDEEINFLLGKSFLDKFTEWTIEPRTATLYLKRQ